MKNILTIIKKEFARFFKDKRLLATTLILPGLLIFVVYSLMGSGILNSDKIDKNYEALIYTISAPESFENEIKGTLSQMNFKAKFKEIDKTNQDEIESIKEKIQTQKVDLLIEFSENFDLKTQPAYIHMYYNSVKTESMATYNMLNEIYKTYQETNFSINDLKSQIQFDLASNEDVAGSIFGMLLPFLILMFLFSGCMSVAPESIAGEKERGTIATLLVTPIKRSELAIGKLASLSVIAVLSAISSFLGTILSLPKMMNGEGINLSIPYQFGDYIALLFIIISTVLIFVGMISMVSAYAKSVKEATTLVTPMMILITIIGIISMFSKSTGEGSIFIYLIPVYNSLKVMGNIFSFHFSALPILITIISNLVYSAIIIFLLTKMFNSEKVMFSR